MSKMLAVILLNYNHQKDTLKCINALQKCQWETEPVFYIIDNSPNKTDEAKFKKVKGNILYFPQKQNGGFAKGINTGLRLALKSKASHFLVINPDVQVGKSFPDILKNFNNDKVGLVAPAIRHLQNKKVMYGLDGFVDWKYAKATHYDTKKLQSKKVTNAEFVTFACVVVSRKAIEKVGLIDERYFMYCEDVDYCLTLKKHKLEILLDPRVIVDHATSSSFSRPTQKLPISFVSQIKFIIKWLPPIKRIFPIIYHLFAYFYLYLLWTYHYAKNNQK